MKCHACGKAVTDRYIKSGSKVYHPEHFVCALCGRPITGRSIVHEKRNFHEQCYFNSIALKCTLCGKIINGRYSRDFWGNIYHAEHSGRNLSCNYCSRYISEKHTGGFRKYNDGRIICNLCFPAAVGDINKARSMLEETRAELKSFGISVEEKLHSFSLTDKPGLSRASGNKLIEGQTGYTYYRMRTLNGKVEAFELNVYVLSGMPEMYFRMTAAHELMHVWQYLNAPLNNSELLCEGSCNYAAYLVLKKYRNSYAEYLINNMHNSTHKIYGKGFKKVSAFVRKTGISGWLEYLRKNKNIPIRY